MDLNLYLFRLSWMKALVKKGYNVYVVVPPGKFSEKFKEYGIKVIYYTIIRGGLNPFREFMTILELYRIFKRQKFDLVNTFTIKPNIYGALAGKLAGVPIIINHVTGLGYIYTDNSLKAKILRLISSLLYRISFKIAKKVIFQNRDDAEDLKNLIDIHKSLVIGGTGVNVKYFSPNNKNKVKVYNLKKELSIRENTIVITLIARLLFHKGIKEVVEAAPLLTKKYRNLLFLIVGGIDKGNPGAITEDFLLESRKNPYIRFLGERDDIKEVLTLTDIYTLPSYREGIPRTVLEAMAMCKPIVTTYAPGCRQTVEEGKNGFLVPVKDSYALASALERLILNKNLREKMGKASREKVLREFSDEVVVKNVLSLYREIY